ncbi:hypothetical protein WN944_024439 [Citrus x changshan-huyou]|uniref:Serine hydroxymethyltransferase-like domain-containing protein n=1 Tax=Citrus x changshan-huyou TaxID=2935761 RepID=A0AAP0LNK6_9ROSI
MSMPWLHGHDGKQVCKAVADKCGALLLCDMAHISGLVAAQYAS